MRTAQQRRSLKVLHCIVHFRILIPKFQVRDTNLIVVDATIPAVQAMLAVSRCVNTLFQCDLALTSDLTIPAEGVKKCGLLISAATEAIAAMPDLQGLVLHYPSNINTKQATHFLKGNAQLKVRFLLLDHFYDCMHMCRCAV